MRILLLCLLLVLPAAAQPFRAGAATSNITPPLGGEIIGGFHPFPSKHVHDDLHARCLVLDDGATKVAIVVLDLLGASERMYDEARRLIVEETGLPAANLFMSCTHTHSAQSALGKDRAALKADLDDYQRFVARRIADGVRRALNNLAPAQIGWAVGSEPREVFNRRWFLKPGTMPRNPFGSTADLVKMNPGYANPNLDRPAGPTDPEVSLIAVRTPEGRPISVFASYSLHYVGGVGAGHISADYFALFADRIQQLLGADRQEPSFVAMIANGTSGDINNNDYSRKPAKKYEPYEKMREVADRVAQAAHTAYQTIQWKDTVPLGARMDTIEIGIRRPAPEQLARAKELLAQPKTDVPTSLDEIYSDRITRLNEWPATIPVPLRALRIGDVAIGGIPNEVFVETGLAFKKRAGFAQSFIVSNSGGYYGYLPTPGQHKLGGYETWLGTSRFEFDASEKILARLLEMVASMK
ncbi:MAG: hypothetical protein ABMA13_01900 [Chthoniobacteraceae bacterium]